MPKIKCKCNVIIPLGEIPNPYQFLVLSEIDFDKLENKIDSLELYRQATIMVKCPNCGRLHVFWNGFDDPQLIYSVDNT